jgi:integrase
VNRRPKGTHTFYQRPDGLWIAAAEAGWTPRGTRRRVTASGKTKAAAQAKLRDKLRALAAGELPTGASDRVTVKKWAEAYLEQTARTLRPETWASNRSALTKWVIPTIGTRKLSSLQPADLRAVASAQRAAGNKPSSALRTHAVMIRMLQAATETHAIAPSIFKMDRPKKNESDRDAIPLPDLRQLLAAAGEHEDGSRWLFQMLYGTRQAETLGLTWDAVDLDKGRVDLSWQLQTLPWADKAAGTFRVPDGYAYRQVYRSYCLVRPKTEKGKRIVPLIGPIAIALREWQQIAPPNPTGLVWPRPDGLPRSAKSDRDEWVALQDAAQVAHVEHQQGRRYTGHETRHSAATLLLALGVDPEIIKRILGHATILTTRGYQHADIEMMRTAIEAAGERLQLG